MFGVEVQQGGAHGGVTRRGGKGGDQSGKNVSHSSSYVCWQQVYEQLALNNPGYKQITLSDGAANVSFNTFGNQRASDRYKFNPHSGKIDKVVYIKMLRRLERFADGSILYMLVVGAVCLPVY